MELPKIKIGDFEGPFDLLLHLIKKNKMDIYNVEIYFYCIGFFVWTENKSKKSIKSN